MKMYSVKVRLHLLAYKNINIWTYHGRKNGAQSEKSWTLDHLGRLICYFWSFQLNLSELYLNFHQTPDDVFNPSNTSVLDPDSPGQVVIVQFMKSLFDVLRLSGSVPITGGPRGSHLPPFTTIGTRCSIALEGEEVLGEEEWEGSYIMANALCPCAVSAGRWCIAQQSRANEQMKQGRAGDGKSGAEKHGTLDTRRLNVKEEMTKKRQLSPLVHFFFLIVETVWATSHTPQRKSNNIIYFWLTVLDLVETVR